MSMGVESSQHFAKGFLSCDNDRGEQRLLLLMTFYGSGLYDAYGHGFLWLH